MLAEKKRKQKWSLNPRGTLWSQDSNKLGQRLLEKMGWSVGKGLGAKGDGITEHIKVKYKNDSQGMGFKSSDDQWTQHESNFSELLNTLSGSSESKKESALRLESLEKKSQNSRARVHYHKFTRGKDLSRYSEKDLANIFGKKNLKEEVASAEENKDNEKDENNTFGVQTLNGGNMIDYFKKKLSNSRKYSVSSEEPSNNKRHSGSESETPGFGFGYKSGKENNFKSSFVSYINEDSAVQNGDNDVNVNEDKIKFKKKKESFRNNIEENDNKDQQTGLIEKEHEVYTPNNKKKRKSENELEVAFTPVKKKFKNFENLSSLEDEEKIECTPAKKLKSKSKKNGENVENHDGENGVSNPAFEPMFSKVSVDKHHLEVINEEDENILEEPNNENLPKEPSNKIFRQISEEAPSHSEIKYKKKKKEKGASISCYENEGLCGSLDEPSGKIDDVLSESCSKKKTKKSKKGKSLTENGLTNSAYEISAKNANLEINNRKTIEVSYFENKALSISPNESTENINDSLSEIYFRKKDKKSKKDRKLLETIEQNSDFNGNEDVEINQKQLVREETIENTYCIADFPEELYENIAESMPENDSSKKVKKPKKNKKHSSAGVENSAFDENFNDGGDMEIGYEAFEIEERQKKKKNGNIEIGLTNSGFNDDSPPDSPNEHKEKRKKKKHLKVVEDIAQDQLQNAEQDFREKASKPKKRKNNLEAVENPGFYFDDSVVSSENTTSQYEVKRKKKEKLKNVGIENLGLDIGSSTPENHLKQQKYEVTIEELEMPVMDDEVMLNVVNTPILKKESVEKPRERRKSVRFSEVNQRIFMNNMDSPADLRKNGYEGLDNEGYDKLGNHLEENIDTLSKQLDDFQAEVENDLNEAKMEVMVGEVGDPNGENEILPNGDVKLKFKYAEFGRLPHWMKRGTEVNAKTSYRHLIKGDITLGFKDTNLHEIKGYKHISKNVEVK